ncbi:MAG: hypothetical protein A3A96_01290 [Candidatus Zambryskibacteria bacterium RIFCSPLOWO2_01_FULL_39_39]|uniref:Pilus assembly protein PilO n=1 Tax=Candidatus Zambryskibacteria bacterium RIFCSPLOWO2_01_FULL_39_39 TaxID=1802758 RepID=A0A1G2TXW6_9BACT|nr:MAG: hypothetical protein UT00_C0026G0006 [Parcubacteria group bacterium GW2011_GWA1_38_7]OHA86791.1 MAG: hypothetical protein A2644_00035 [Candidatus Zambryskibacteria bacterium RIFCSPHIGHO2_01_FULL_39_63]OHA94682.1 MAG: hypothetical protein A3B88_00550 [Candidatus Zambryskibacteria bacterium RIFCSPHIGHO2_02_FULL_39_19]OHA98554.1 MAG: hypothetical protein A3F20_00985 [Candidatus Zambryskibacteria bacterium RIFCSPHIGHO2_12_FULL_39_21]OHB02145.1 MAG: hypothetical protein A3A96_01290 [Candidat
MSGISIVSYIILTLAIGYSFVYPSLGDLSTLSDQKQKYVDSLEIVNNIENKKNELLDKLNEISADDKKSIETILPNSLEFVKLISQIDVVASKYAISINTITSREVAPHSPNSIEDVVPQQTYRSSVIGFSFSASYDDANAFLDDLEKSLRILDVRSVKLETQDAGVYAYNVEFETYWFK